MNKYEKCWFPIHRLFLTGLTLIVLLSIAGCPGSGGGNNDSSSGAGGSELSIPLSFIFPVGLPEVLFFRIGGSGEFSGITKSEMQDLLDGVAPARVTASAFKTAKGVQVIGDDAEFRIYEDELGAALATLTNGIEPGTVVEIGAFGYQGDWGMGRLWRGRGREFKPVTYLFGNTRNVTISGVVDNNVSAAQVAYDLGGLQELVISPPRKETIRKFETNREAVDTGLNIVDLIWKSFNPSIFVLESGHNSSTSVEIGFGRDREGTGKTVSIPEAAANRPGSKVTITVKTPGATGVEASTTLQPNGQSPEGESRTVQYDTPILVGFGEGETAKYTFTGRIELTEDTEFGRETVFLLKESTEVQDIEFKHELPSFLVNPVMMMKSGFGAYAEFNYQSGVEGVETKMVSVRTEDANGNQWQATQTLGFSGRKEAGIPNDLAIFAALLVGADLPLPNGNDVTSATCSGTVGEGEDATDVGVRLQFTLDNS